MYKYLYIVLAACGPLPQTAVEYPIVATGTPVTARMIGEWSVTLDRAALGFGPLYFCASQSARASLCGTAAAELLAVTEIDLLDPSVQPLGTVHGLTGSIRSATWDYALTWLMTEPQPRARSASGHSLVMSGTAVRGATVVPFSITVDATPKQAGTHAVLGSRTIATITDRDVAVELRFDPGLWLEGVDFSAIANDDPAILLNMTANAPPTFVWSVR